MGKMTLAFVVVLPGVVGVVVFAYFALIDWEALQAAYQELELAVEQSADLNILFARATQQNIHRINLFAEGVWTLLSAILVAIGLQGICTGPRRSRG